MVGAATAPPVSPAPGSFCLQFERVVLGRSERAESGREGGRRRSESAAAVDSSAAVHTNGHTVPHVNTTALRRIQGASVPAATPTSPPPHNAQWRIQGTTTLRSAQPGVSFSRLYCSFPLVRNQVGSDRRRWTRTRRFHSRCRCANRQGTDPVLTASVAGADRGFGEGNQVPKNKDSTWNVRKWETSCCT